MKSQWKSTLYIESKTSRCKGRTEPIKYWQFKIELFPWQKVIVLLSPSLSFLFCTCQTYFYMWHIAEHWHYCKDIDSSAPEGMKHYIKSGTHFNPECLNSINNKYWLLKYIFHFVIESTHSTFVCVCAFTRYKCSVTSRICSTYGYFR